VTVDPILIVAVLVVAGFLVLRAVGPVMRRATRRWARRIVRRALGAVAGGFAYVILGKWLRRNRVSRTSPPVDLTRTNYLATCRYAAFARQGRPVGVPGTCRWCARPLPERCKVWCTARCRIACRSNHEFAFARDAALERDRHQCVRPGCGATATWEWALEVNHMDACLGRHNVAGCWHHLEPDAHGRGGLETLCHQHHLDVTNGQRSRGEFDRRRRWVA
jgi:hypothetical protein